MFSINPRFGAAIVSKQGTQALAERVHSGDRLKLPVRDLHEPSKISATDSWDLSIALQPNGDYLLCSKHRWPRDPELKQALLDAGVPEPEITTGV